MGRPRKKKLDPEQNAKIDAIIMERIRTNATGNAGHWTEKEKELRDDVIWDYICKQGMSRKETERQIAERWQISRTSAYNYVREAVKRFSNLYNEQSREEIKSVITERCEAVLTDCVTQRDRANALRTLELMSKLAGLMSEKKEIEVKGEIPIKFDFGE